MSDKELLSVARPDLLEEWNYEKNVKSPENFTLGSGVKVWWKCLKCNGEWEASIFNRSKGRGCPYCAGQKILKGFNDLATTNPEVLNSWDYDKNQNQLSITPDMVTSGSNKIVWWKCNIGHSYDRRVKEQLKGQECPYCSGKRVLEGFNDLKSLKPKLAEEWDYEKNEGLKPNEVTAFSHKDVWWKCEEGHSWKSKISNRSNGLGCPYCNGTRAIVGVNDLLTIHPEFTEEWDYEKNDVNPLELKPGSNIRVWWKCKRCGHSWQTSPNKRTYEKTGCPRCGNKGTSFSEVTIYYYIKQCFPNAINRYDYHGYEVDIFIPEIQTGIEYDGVWYHKDKYESDVKKSKALSELGITIIHIREEGLEPIPNGHNIFRNSQAAEGLENCIVELFELIHNKVDRSVIDIERDYAEIQELIFLNEVSNSIENKAPQLIKDWNYDKNGSLLPSQVSCYSNQKVWWKCDLGHEWTTTPAHRMEGKGCPYCSGRKVLKGYNDLATVNPKLASQWDYDNNKDLTPESITASSHKMVWWKCVQGHRWRARINSRHEGNGCPYCSGRFAISGLNDLETLFPKVLESWDYEKNTGINPKELLPQSNKKVWWICNKCGFEWKTSISHRTSGRGCPNCAMVSRKRKLSKAVVCVETNRTFNSLEEAAKWAGVTKGAISMCALGKIKTSGGYRWKYINETDEK